MLWRIEHSLTDPPVRRPAIPAGHCYEAERSLPYYPFVEAFRSIMPYIDLEKLGVPDVWLAEVNRLLPDIAELRPDLPTPPRLDPHQEQRRLFEGLARFLAALPTPTLVVLADLHRADSGTLQLLAYLVRDESDAACDVPRHRPPGGGRRAARRPRARSRTRGARRYHPARAAPPRCDGRTPAGDGTRGRGNLADRLHAETEGNPLFVIEIVRSLMEQGMLQLGAANPQEIRDLALPDTIQAVIRSRLERLDAASRQFLTAAAIFDGGFDFDDALAVSGQPEDEGLDALETLLRARLLREPTERVGPTTDTLRYVFDHDKLRQVVYEGSSGARRRILHRRVVEVLSARGTVGPERLAYHAIRGQIWDRALDWTEAAAAAAMKVYAYTDAVRLYQQALECL